MNSHLRQMIIEKSRGEQDHARQRRRRYDRYGTGDREMDYRQGRRRDYDMDYGMDYGEDYDYERDGRRGVKGTGRYGIGGSRYYGRRRRDYDMGDYRDYADDEDEVKVSKNHLKKWEKELMNADGSHGKHFDEAKLMPIAEKLGIKFDEYDEEEFVLVANMLYSDYCEALKSIVTPEREHIVYSKLAKAWLEDEDAPQGSEKLALYYYCIVDDEE